jgi:carbamoyl-phosphate synthase small subunit
MKAFLILEDSTVFEGTHIGADKEIISEIVFNTSMTGYLEVLTDPSYAGQAVCMTYPLIGNYGICRDDMESSKPWPDGFIVRELSRVPSNFRSDMTIQQFLNENGIPGIAGIDTRALTRILREKGTMNGMITTDKDHRLEDILSRLKEYTTGKVVEKATCPAKYSIAPTTALEQNGPLSGTARFDRAAYEHGEKEKRPALVKSINGSGLRVALLDLGAKSNIARSLAERGCTVTVYPALTPAAEIIEDTPDGIMLSNRSGDPKECTAIIEQIRKLYNTDIPIFAICLGHADKSEAIEIGRRFEKLGYTIYTTENTAAALNEMGVKARKVNKISQESPTVIDLILGHRIDLVINTPTQGRDKSRNGFLIRYTTAEDCQASVPAALRSTGCPHSPEHRYFSENIYASVRWSSSS